MGQKLLEMYKKAEQMGKLKAKMRLAMLTNVPSAKAATEPDSPENIQKFNQAILELQKEFK